MASDFTKKYLQLRKNRAGTAAPAASAGQSESTRETAPAASSGGDSFTSRYLSIRNSRNRKSTGSTLPTTRLVSPLSFPPARPASGTDRSDTQKTAQTSRTDRRAQLESDLAKVNQEQRLLSARTNLARRSRGFTTEDREAAEAEAAPLRRKAEDLRHGVEGIDYQDKYDAITRKDNFGGQFLSSYDVGRMWQDEAMAWYEYLSDPTEGNRAYAESVSAALQDYILRNQAALDEDATLPIISQSLARYLPQFIDQNVAGVKGALAGAAAGSVLPVAGTAAGAKAGYAGGRALYGYETARGAAFKALLDAGVDEETARAASNDEAIINSVIEGGDAVLDMLTLGIGRGVSAILGQPAEAAATSAGRKVLSALGKYGINVASEGAQEWVQEGVSAANEGRAGTGLLDLVGESAGQIGRAVTGQDPEALARMNEAGLEGLRVAAIMGGAGMIGNAAVSRVLGQPADQQQVQENNAENTPVLETNPQEGPVQFQNEGEIDSGIPEVQEDAGENGLLLRAADEAAQNGRVSNRTASSILDNPSAVSALSAEAGLELTDGMTMAQRRAAVKNAVEGLARRATDTERQTMDTGTTGAQTDVQRPAARRVYDAGRLRGISSALGENGAKALNAVYDGGTDADRFYAGFAAYYQAGVSGRSIDSVRSDYAGQLSSAQQFAAYSAGQNDAATSLAAERERVPYATVYGSESGFIPNEHSAGIDQETTRFYNDLARATGTKITTAAATGAGGANGWYRDGTIYIAADAENAGQVVAKHEITHRLQEIAPEEYRTYRDYAVNALSERDGSSAALVERYRARYAAAGQNLTVEQAMDEIAADFTEALTTDPARFERLAQDNRSVARKVLDALKDFIRRVKSLFKGRGGQNRAALNEYGVTMDTLERAARLWEDALRAGSRRASALQGGRADGTMDSTRYSLKEDQDYGRRKETRTDFLRRAAGEGYSIFEGEACVYGYRPGGPVQGESAQGRTARQVQEEVRRLGIDADIIDGPVLWNQNGVTGVRNIPEAVTVEHTRIFISSSSTVSPRNAAGHEAFHIWEGSNGRVAYEEAIEDNLLYTSEAFLDYQSRIADAYLGGEADLTDSAQVEKLREELFAYISGDIHEGTNDDTLRAMFRDYDAVKAAWETLVQENGRGQRFSLKSTDSQGRELTPEQQEFFRDSKITDSEGRLLVLYHGTTTYGEIIKFRRGRSGWLGPGIYLASRRADAQRYADAMGEGNGQLYELYANVTNPLVVAEGNPVPEILRAAYGRDSIYKSRSAKQSNDTRIITPADIKKLQSKGYDGIRWDFGGNAEVSVFSTEQIKRVDNQTPTSDPDIRRSLKGDILRENAALQEENALLRDRVDYWRGQTRRIQRVTTDKKAVERTARELIAAYHADLETADVAADLQSLYDYIASGRDGSDELTYTEARRRADELARKLVEHAVVEDTEAYDDYSGLRQYLRTTPLSISEEDSSNIPDYGDFRRRNFGRIHLRKGPTNIDQVYQELSELWPEFFDEARESHPADQLVHIAEVLDGIYQVTERNPFAAYLSESVADASNEILERFFDLPQTRRTFADRAEARLDAERARGRRRVEQVRRQRDERLAELRRQNRERVQRTVQRERQTRERQLDRLKKRYAARDAAGRERRNARELRARISRHVGDLSRKLLRPSDKQHIPEQLRTAVANMLDAINLESVYTVDPETGARRKGGDGGPTKRTESFRTLRQAYAAITKEGADYTLIVDPDLLDNLTELEAMRDTPLAEMSTVQLKTVWDTIRAVEASVRTANRMLGESRFRTISQAAEGIRSDNMLRQDRGDYRGVLGKVDKLVNLDMLTPQGYFHRMGQTGDALFRMLRSAQDRHVEIMRSAQEATREIIGKLNVNELERETHTFDVDGGKLTLSTAQIMSLYELLKREQAREHIFVGGIRPEAIRSGHGLRESRRSSAVHVGIEDLAEITGVLTEEQTRVADALQHYMGADLSELGNQASMEVYGYRKFTEPNYFPISVDRNQTQKDIAKEAQAQTIAGRGFTKGTVPRANNAVMVGSIFDVFASHVNDMATYAAWLSTMENVRRIRDFTFRDSEGARTGTVKDIIERIFGRNGNAYLNKLIDDLNQGIRAAGSGNFMDAIVGNYKAAAVAANLRVIAQQPTAILRALNTLDAKYLLAGTVKRGDWQKVMKYAPIARWKDWGYFDINTGRQMKDVLFDSDSRLEKVRQAGMAAAGRADSFSWARLWNAVEAETRDRRPGLKPGTDAFYRAVGARFSEIVDQTQVVDGILQRSQIMRSPDGLTKMSTSFMGEPTKSYNMFVNALYDLRHATGREGRRRAGRALARTSAALVVSFTINAVMQSLVDGLRDDDKELDYWERVLRAFTGFTGDEETFLDYWNSFWSGNLEASYNPLAYMPYFKDLVSIAQGFDVTRMDMEAVEKVFTAFTNMRKALTGEGRYTVAGASANMLAETARMFGIPVANLKRDIQAVVTAAAIETDNYLLQYRMDRFLLNMGYAGNRSGFLDILYAASINDPEAYEIIYSDMVSSGKITEEQIRTGMESRMKRDQGVTSAEELERRYLPPGQERTYDRLYSQISASPVWSEATTAQQEAVEEDLYDLAAGTEAGKKLREKIDGGTAYGVTEADYLLYLAAREIADARNEDPEKRNGSIDQAEAEAAIDMLTGLSDEARAYLWQSTNKGWKADNNPYN